MDCPYEEEVLESSFEELGTQVLATCARTQPRGATYELLPYELLLESWLDWPYDDKVFESSFELEFELEFELDCP